MLEVGNLNSDCLRVNQLSYKSIGEMSFFLPLKLICAMSFTVFLWYSLRKNIHCFLLGQWLLKKCGSSWATLLGLEVGQKINRQLVTLHSRAGPNRVLSVAFGPLVFPFFIAELLQPLAKIKTSNYQRQALDRDYALRNMQGLDP